MPPLEYSNPTRNPSRVSKITSSTESTRHHSHQLSPSHTGSTSQRAPRSSKDAPIHPQPALSSVASTDSFNDFMNYVPTVSLDSRSSVTGSTTLVGSGPFIPSDVTTGTGTPRGGSQRAHMLHATETSMSSFRNDSHRGRHQSREEIKYKVEQWVDNVKPLYKPEAPYDEIAFASDFDCKSPSTSVGVASNPVSKAYSSPRRGSPPEHRDNFAPITTQSEADYTIEPSVHKYPYNRPASSPPKSATLKVIRASLVHGESHRAESSHGSVRAAPTPMTPVAVAESRHTGPKPLVMDHGSRFVENFSEPDVGPYPYEDSIVNVKQTAETPQKRNVLKKARKPEDRR
ncbi:hypothetical protein BDN70DRAFT_937021 [Pholiota conissans]|uniref:Uncharacterized protein n=1 Tax=Pholiota conissans TaxID=109636 RepID=A0A9P5YQC9_9AGAR|nr:hypothetical protein BDN70DRAFT_937021 [Pholiota conissans]